MRRFTLVLVPIIGILLLMLAILSPPRVSSLQADATATPEATPTPAPVPGESAALIVIVSTADNEPPRADSTVMIFDGDEAVKIGITDGGAYRAVLPEGEYDIAVLHASMPNAALLAREFEVSGTEPVTLTLVVPAENSLNLSVRTPNGNPPKNGFSIVIYSDGVEVAKKNMAPQNGGDATFNLRGDILYDIVVSYGDREVRERGVSVQGDSALTILLPADEGTVDVFLQDDGAALAENAQLVVIDETGREFLANTKVLDSQTVYLPAGATYRVIGQYQGILAADSVSVEAGGLHPVTLDFAAPEPLPSLEQEATPEAPSSG